MQKLAPPAVKHLICPKYKEEEVNKEEEVFLPDNFQVGFTLYPGNCHVPCHGRHAEKERIYCKLLF